MNHLPEALLLLTCEFLDYVDQIEYICCSKVYYSLLMKSFIRKVVIKKGKLFSNEKLYQSNLSRLLSIVSNVSAQVGLDISELSSYSGDEVQHLIVQFLQSLNYSCHHLNLASFQFLEILNAVESISVKRLNLYRYSRKDSAFELADWEHMVPLLAAKLRDCQQLKLFSERSSMMLPHFPSLCSLELYFHISSQPLPVAYFSHLQKLVFNKCKIQDVSLFGSIPSLTFIECSELQDISPLSNNRVVQIVNCAKVEDYSQSFANSREINVIQPWNDWLLNFDHWRQVSSLVLVLHSSMDNSQIRLTNDQLGKHRLPRTLRRCELRGKIIDCIDLHINSTDYPHLQEMALRDSSSIISLEGLGFNSLGVIRLHSLTNLTSLVGLGSGKNQKIVISNCSLITDFTPVRNVREVVIQNCPGFRKLSEVSGVSRLHLSQCAGLLKNDLSAFREFSSLQVLKLLTRTAMNVTTFQVLTTIPDLVLSENYQEIFGNFLKGKGKLANRSLRLWMDSRHQPSLVDIERGLQVYLKSSYQWRRVNFSDKHLSCLILLRRNRPPPTSSSTKAYTSKIGSMTSQKVWKS